MEPLLEIRTIPISLELQIQHAKLEYQQEQPSYHLTRSGGKLEVDFKPARMRMDTYELRSSMGYKGAIDATLEGAEAGKRAVTEAIATIAQEGKALMNIQQGFDVAKLAENRMLQDTQQWLDTRIGTSPSAPPDISWDASELTIQYENERLFFDWRTSNRPTMTYHAAKVEFIVKERPRVEIKYLGGPQYVPPSADPNYEPPVLNVSA